LKRKCIQPKPPNSQLPRQIVLMSPGMSMNRTDATGNRRDVTLSRIRTSRILLYIKTEAVVADACEPKVYAQCQDEGMHLKCTLLSVSLGLVFD